MHSHRDGVAKIVGVYITKLLKQEQVAPMVHGDNMTESGSEVCMVVLNGPESGVRIVTLSTESAGLYQIVLLV